MQLNSHVLLSLIKDAICLASNSISTYRLWRSWQIEPQYLPLPLIRSLPFLLVSGVLDTFTPLVAIIDCQWIRNNRHRLKILTLLHGTAGYQYHLGYLMAHLHLAPRMIQLRTRITITHLRGLVARIKHEVKIINLTSNAAIARIVITIHHWPLLMGSLPYPRRN